MNEILDKMVNYIENTDKDLMKMDQNHILVIIIHELIVIQLAAGRQNSS